MTGRFFRKPRAAPLRRDGVARALFAVGELRRDGELARAADFHAGEAFFPAGHDFLLPERELKRVLLFLARIELRPVGEPAGVVHDDVPAGRGCRALADDGVFDGQAACRGDGGHGNSLVVETLAGRKNGFRPRTGRAGVETVVQRSGEAAMYAKGPGLATSIGGDRNDLPGKAAPPP
jgi:hypothetical protein